MEETITPYQLPDVENHSFFYVDSPIKPELEAKLHHHDAWELLYVIHGYGNRIAGDTTQPFVAGDIALIPPNMLHQWSFSGDSVNSNGEVSYLMVAFSNALVLRCMEQFPELRNQMKHIQFPIKALKFGPVSAHIIRKQLLQMKKMDELQRLSGMFQLLPVIFGSSDCIFVGSPMRIERDVRRIQQITTYIMRHYVHTITLDDIAAEIGMNRSAFCSYFKRIKGITFTQFLVEYRIITACELLKNSQKQVSEICYAVGFNDLPHFVRVFTKKMGISPSKYRKQTDK